MGGSPAWGAHGRSWGAPKPRPPPTEGSGASVDPPLGEPQGPPYSGVTRAVGRVFTTWRTQTQQLAQRSWAGQSRQTAVPEAGAGWHSRHFSTSINQHAQAEEGEGRGRWRVGSHYPHPTLPTLPPHPGLAPTGSYWDQRHLLGRKGILPGPPGAGRGRHCLAETWDSVGAVLRACA